MTPAAFTEWLASAPPGTTLDAAEVHAILSADDPIDLATLGVHGPNEPDRMTWRERLWTAHEETRLGVSECAEAIGRPKSFVYRRTAEKTGLSRIPHRKLDGELVFVVSEIRDWVRRNEEVVESA